MATSALAASSPPPEGLFTWTDGLRGLIAPQNLAPSSGPIPTNAWWGNLLAWPHGDRDSDPIFANPYAYHVSPGRGLAVAYLRDYRVDGPVNENGAIKYYFYPATIKNVVLSAREWASSSTSTPTLGIEAWDDLGVTLRLADAAGAKGGGGGHARTYLSTGNALTTMTYQDLHAQLQSDHGLVDVNGQPYQEGTRVPLRDGNRLDVQFNNTQRWALFVFPRAAPTGTLAPPVEFTMAHNALTTAAPFTGIVQLAFVSSETMRQEDPGVDARVLGRYRASAGIYATGAAVYYTDDGAATPGFGFEWTLAMASPSPGGMDTCPAGPIPPYLHFALPHLQRMLDESTAAPCPELQLRSHTRGLMRAYALRPNTRRWHFTVPRDLYDALSPQATSFLPLVGQVPPSTLVQELGLAEIVRQEVTEVPWASSIPHEGSYYFKGKALQRLGTICLVAKALVETTNPELKGILEQARSQYRDVMHRFVENKSAFPLVYDTVYRGIITGEAIAKRDINVDFGNAVYNDHHYHYGYLITAAAMFLHLDGPPQTPQQQHMHVQIRTFTETLIRDVVTTEPNDPYFPRFRQYSWFLGHSYSHGVTPMADGKDEESTSEEVNFLYGLALYGHVTENGPLTNLAKIMLTVNALSIRTYFLLSNDSDTQDPVHPKAFLKNKVTGICFDNKCDYATWFSPLRECIHGIQMIPVSPMLDLVRPKVFIREEWEEILAKLECVKNWASSGTGWTSLLYSNAAVLDPVLATTVLKTCPMDDGLSRAWALYMAATKRH